MRRLYTRIYLHLLGMLAIVAAVTGGIFAQGFRTAYFRNFTERLVRHGANLVGERWRDPPARDAMVRRLAAELDVEITIRDESGQALAAAGSMELPPLEPDEAKRAREGETSFTHRHRGWYAVAPIIEPRSGAVLGTIQAAPVSKPRAPPVWRPILTVALLLLIVAAATAPLARRISRPVERLTEAVRRFGAGDLGYRVQLPERFGARFRKRHRHAIDDELAQLTRAWNEMAERIEQLVRGQKELLANVSHELRSPLSRIRVALELLPRDESTEARVRDLEGDLTELEQLIDDVLTASRLEATRIPARLDTVEAGPLLQSLADRARIDPATADTEVRAEANEAPVLVADAALLKRALWNLVENAAKYGAPPIVLSVERRDDRAIFRVTDAGPGIAAADRARVFEPFFRADKARTPRAASSSPGARGYGLGLTIARRVAEVHGGTIRVGPARVEGGREIGCEVVLDLPIEAKATAAA